MDYKGNVFKYLLNKAKMEDELYEKNCLDERDKIYLQRQNATEEFARNLAQKRDEENAALKRKQWLYLNSHEIRDFQSQMQQGYTTRTLTAQMAEKECARQKEKIKAVEDDALVTKCLLPINEAEKEEKENIMKQKYQYKKALQDQIILMEQLKLQEYEEVMRDKKLRDATLQKINDEDRLKAEFNLCRFKQIQKEKNDFLAVRDMWRKKQLDELQEENRNIQKYTESKENNEAKVKEQVKQKHEKRMQLVKKLSIDLYAEEKKKKDKQDLICGLEEELNQLRLEERIINEEKHDKALKKSLFNSIEMIVKQKKEAALKEALEDKKYREYNANKILEEERAEKSAAEKHRLKMIMYRKELEETIRKNRELKAQHMQREKLLYQAEQERANKFKNDINRERLVMIEKHAGCIKDYVHRNTIRKDEYEKLNLKLRGS